MYTWPAQDSRTVPCTPSPLLSILEFSPCPLPCSHLGWPSASQTVGPARGLCTCCPHSLHCTRSSLPWHFCSSLAFSVTCPDFTPMPLRSASHQQVYEVTLLPKTVITLRAEGCLSALTRSRQEPSAWQRAPRGTLQLHADICKGTGRRAAL